MRKPIAIVALIAAFSLGACSPGPTGSLSATVELHTSQWGWLWRGVPNYDYSGRKFLLRPISDREIVKPRFKDFWD
jgi:hypothetical protein